MTIRELMTEPPSVLAERRYQDGMAIRGRAPGDPFVGDPILEAAEEALDGINYCQEVIGPPGGLKAKAPEKLLLVWWVLMANHHFMQAFTALAKAAESREKLECDPKST